MHCTWGFRVRGEAMFRIGTRFKLSMLIPVALGLGVEATPHLVDTRVVLLVT